jgi:hypothetical protein
LELVLPLRTVVTYVEVTCEAEGAGLTVDVGSADGEVEEAAAMIGEGEAVAEATNAVTSGVDSTHLRGHLTEEEDIKNVDVAEMFSIRTGPPLLHLRIDRIVGRRPHSNRPLVETRRVDNRNEKLHHQAQLL